MRLCADAVCLTTCAVIVEEASKSFDEPFHGFSANDMQSLMMLLPLLLKEVFVWVNAW